MTQKKFRRFSEIKNPKPELDLRQELLNLNLKNSEVDCWLGSKFDETEEDELEEDFRFNHDIPLQRSISLDRGLDIFNYLQTIGSNTSSDISTSSWTVSSKGNSDLRLEQYRSFEDIPASPIRVKSRHISLDVTNSMYSKNFALSVLKESYVGIDEDGGDVSPSIRKLQKTFSFKNFDDYKASAKNSNENLIETDNAHDTNSQTKVHIPVYRDIKLGSKDDIAVETERNPRQRRVGVITNEWHEKADTDLKINVLTKHGLGNCKSEHDLFVPNKNETKLQGASSVSFNFKETLKRSKSGEAIINLRKLKRTLPQPYPKNYEQSLPTIVIMDTDSIDNKTNNFTEDITLQENSNLEEIDVSCSCQICIGDNEKNEDNSFIKRNLNRLLLRIVTYKDFAKKVTWDDKSDMKENEMWTCIINVLKWMLGLWLRHFDHKQNKICAS